jgi:hypothetical protein
MTVRSCIIGFGVLVIIWLGVTTARTAMTQSQAISVAIAGS